MAGVTRRDVLVAGGGLVVGAGLTAGAAGVLARRSRAAAAEAAADALIPDASSAGERAWRRRSEARGKEVDFYVAVPEASDDGHGLPVCLVLHGASSTAADFSRFGFASFLNASVGAGTPPFVLAARPATACVGSRPATTTRSA